MISINQPLSLSDDPVFIVGPGRSGTTLVRKILSAHPRITILPETHFIKWADQRGDLYDELPDFEKIWSEYTDWVRFTYLDIDRIKCNELIKSSQEKTFEAIFRSVMISYAEKSGKPRIGEKSPSHVRYIDVLLSWFPNCKIIIMQRDPRAVVASKLGTPWVQKRTTSASLHKGYFQNGKMNELINGAEAWSNIFENIVPDWRSDSRVKIVSYEELCRTPESVIKNICQFLGEKYTIDMISNRSSKNESFPEDQNQAQKVKEWKDHHSRSIRPITADSIEKWKKKLTSTEIAIIESTCKKGMKRMGYDMHITPSRRFFGQLLCFAFLTFERVERAIRISGRSMRQAVKELIKS